MQFSCQVSTAYWLYQIKSNSHFTETISLLSSLQIHRSHSKIKESEHKKSLKSKSSATQSLNLFLSANNQPPSTSTTALAPHLFYFSTIDGVLFSSHRENQSPHNNNGVSPFFTR
jgi:hypothetical protein